MPEPFCQTEAPSPAARDFIEAVKASDLPRLRELLAGNAELLEQIDEPWFSFDQPAVVFAASKPEVVELLLDVGADLNVRSRWHAGGFGVLDQADPEIAERWIARGAVLDAHAAARLGKLDELRQLVARDPGAVHAPGGDGQRPLHFARQPEIIDFLLEAGAELEARDVDHGATAAQYALEDPEVCRYLIARGAEVDIFMACALGDAGLVDQVLEREPDCLASRMGSCLHTRDSLGGHIYTWRLQGAETPVEVADAFGHGALRERLIDESPPPDRFTALCWFGRGEEARQLLDAHPDLLARLSPPQRAMMARAAWERRRHVVELLLDLGLDPHLPGAEQSTPLDRAAFHGFDDVVALLLERDPQPPLEARNAYDSTPLGTCVYGAVHGWRRDGDHVATAERLLQAGARYRATWLPTGHPPLDAVLDRFPEARDEE